MALKIKQIEDLLSELNSKIAKIQILTNPNLGNSDLDVASQRAIKQYVDTNGGSGGSGTYTHNQPTPSASWLINHDLGKYPSVTIIDSANSVVIGNIVYNDQNNLTVSFSAPFSGAAYLN